jgi:glycosyltransferase involved in cell wall biosynthesis
VFKRGRRQSFFSVVIASYNSAAWIKHTIRSVLEQTYRNFEVIVVGDGCTDGTEELLKTKFGKRIRWKNLPNPNPRHFLSIRTTGPVQLRIHVIAFAAEDLAHSLRIDIDDREADFVCERSSDGTYIFSGQFSTAVNDGLALRFRMPRSVPIATDFGTRRAGLALSRVEITLGRD